MTDKIHADTGATVDTITYAPALQDSGDMEPAVITIAPVSRPAVAAAQYNKSFILPRPSDARLEVKRIVSRLRVNIAGLGAATHLHLSVRVDQDDANHELFSEDWTSTGEKLDAVDVYSANKSGIFDLLKDGLAHIFYFLFWADTANKVSVDTVQLWEAVGSCSTNENQTGCLSLTHAGAISDMVLFITIGTGIASFRRQDTTDNASYFTRDTTNYGRKSVALLLVNTLAYNIAGSI